MATKPNNCTIIIADSARKVGINPQVIRANATQEQINAVFIDELGMNENIFGVWWDESTVDALGHRFNDYVEGF